MSEASKKTPYWKDTLLLATELVARQAYWRLPWLRDWTQRRRANRQPSPQIADCDELKAYLQSIGVTEGALVMAHTSTLGLCLTEKAGFDLSPRANNGARSPVATAKQLLDELFALIGQSGTLVMPTHVQYHTKCPVQHSGGEAKPFVYDPTKTPCCVGLVNEMFWRSPGVQRSLHPYNTLAARGPLAAELLRDNLNEMKPLPHGMHSGYYRFCQHNGLVVSVGAPLGRYMTLIHTAEEVRDTNWPVADFFEERRYWVRTEGETKEWIVRQRRAVFGMFCLCMRKLVRDLLYAGVLHEGIVGTVRVDWARSREVFDFLMERNRLSPYPYFGTRWMREPR